MLLMCQSSYFLPPLSEFVTMIMYNVFVFFTFLHKSSNSLSLSLSLNIHLDSSHNIPIFSWTDLLNVFEVFLPQLLLYPNPSDPLNGDAASLMMKDRKQYDQKVKGEIWFLPNLPSFFILLSFQANQLQGRISTTYWNFTNWELAQQWHRGWVARRFPVCEINLGQ